MIPRDPHVADCMKRITRYELAPLGVRGYRWTLQCGHVKHMSQPVVHETRAYCDECTKHAGDTPQGRGNSKETGAGSPVAREVGE